MKIGDGGNNGPVSLGRPGFSSVFAGAAAEVCNEKPYFGVFSLVTAAGGSKNCFPRLKSPRPGGIF